MSTQTTEDFGSNGFLSQLPTVDDGPPGGMMHPLNIVCFFSFDFFAFHFLVEGTLYHPNGVSLLRLGLSDVFRVWNSRSLTYLFAPATDFFLSTCGFYCH